MQVLLEHLESPRLPRPLRSHGFPCAHAPISIRYRRETSNLSHSQTIQARDFISDMQVPLEHLDYLDHLHLDHMDSHARTYFYQVQKKLQTALTAKPLKLETLFSTSWFLWTTQTTQTTWTHMCFVRSSGGTYLYQVQKKLQTALTAKPHKLGT